MEAAGEKANKENFSHQADKLKDLSVTEGQAEETKGGRTTRGQDGSDLLIWNNGDGSDF